MPLRRRATKLVMTDVVSRSVQPLTADVDGQLVILSSQHNQYLNLGSIGGAIWQRMATPVRIDALCVELAGEYDAPLSSITPQVTEFLTELVAEGLVDVVR